MRLARRRLRKRSPRPECRGSCMTALGIATLTKECSRTSGDYAKLSHLYPVRVIGRKSENFNVRTKALPQRQQSCTETELHREIKNCRSYRNLATARTTCRNAVAKRCRIFLAFRGDGGNQVRSQNPSRRFPRPAIRRDGRLLRRCLRWRAGHRQ
jgi:hypothetical protein